MKHLKTISIIAAVLIGGLGLITYYQKSALANIDENNLPKIIQADWIDLARIGYISKFRSGSGHDFSEGGEQCRSMKHYFNIARTEQEQQLISKNNGYPPAFSLEGAIPIYSPVDGKIVDIREDGSLGSQIFIEPTNYSNYTIRLFHIFPLDGLKNGRSVQAGEQVGNIGQLQNTDIAVSVGGLFGRRFVSYFQVMPDDIFAKYQAVGVKRRDQLIVTKAYRDAHPLKCKGEWFAENYDSSGDEYVFINGYSLK